MTQRNSDTNTAKSMLIVDEDLELVGCITSHCRSIGLEVRTASSVNEAVVLMNAKMPDLLCADIDLPAIKDQSFFERLSTNGQTRDIPAIVLCQSKDLNSLQRLESLRGYYVYKSVDSMNTIEMFINELIDVHSTEAECQCFDI